ncbi:MAG: threonylcarbamoyl-AMP synthase [Clostridia bacterium]|nr:threonylcarbamoyl-AMP synthase [Clostridia bacterium]
MITYVLPIDNVSLEMAKSEIMRSGVVAFPTETVYGLAANAFDTAAVEKVFAVKGRPNDNPLIVHVHKDYDLSELVTEIPYYAQLLAKAFLPGPLTMVYKSKDTISKAVSCGLDTVAIRIPSHEGAQRFLKYVDVPIAAPSANLSKHVSPVTAKHVFDDLNGKIPLILDGGKCSGGIESTVLDCTGKIPCVLRSGLISREMIAQVAGECDEYVFKDGEKVRSPGMKYKHYSPRCETVLFGYNDREKAFELYRAKSLQGVKAFLMCDDWVAKQSGCPDILNLGKNENEIAANLYDKLREGEAVAELIIAVAPQKQDGVMVGVMNRLKKACG